MVGRASPSSPCDTSPTADARALLGTLWGAARACDGPTLEQRAVLDALSVRLCGIDPGAITPLDPGPAAEAVEDEDRPLAVGGVITLEMAHHAPTEELAATTAEYLATLGAASDYQEVVRDQIPATETPLRSTCSGSSPGLDPAPSTTSWRVSATAPRARSAGRSGTSTCATGSSGHPLRTWPATTSTT